MKVKAVAGITVLLFALFSNSAFADDPCKVTLCLWGKMNGSSRDGCSSAEKSFFNIVKKKHGSFRPDRTFDARKQFLNNECPSVYDPNNFVGKVLGKYGRVMNG